MGTGRPAKTAGERRWSPGPAASSRAQTWPPPCPSPAAATLRPGRLPGKPL